MLDYYLEDGACCDAWASMSNHPASAFLNTWDIDVCSTPSSAECLKPHSSQRHVYHSTLAPAGARGHYAVTHTFFLAMGRPRGLS